MDCLHPAAANLRANLTRLCGEDEAARIVDVAPLSPEATDTEKAEWVRRVVAALEARFSEDAVRLVMMGCHCDDICRLGEMKEWLGGHYRESASMEEFVERMNRHGAGWELKDGEIYTRFLWCECHMLREVDALDSKTWCYCTEGYTKALFEHVLGSEVESELVQTIRTGHDCCIVKIRPTGGARYNEPSARPSPPA